MAYSTLNDLLTMIPLKELAELTTDSGDTPDSQVVAEAIARADAEIDAYVGVRYALPFSTVPDQVRGLSVDMALYHLYSRRSVAPAVRRQKYEAALSFLKQVAAGEAVVDGADGLLPETTQVGSEFTGSPRVFSRSTMGDW